MAKRIKLRISRRQSLWAHKHTVVLKTFDGQICYIYCIFPELLPNNAAESRCFDRAFDVSFLSTLPAGLVEVNLCLTGDASDLVFCSGGLALEAGEITWVMEKELSRDCYWKEKDTRKLWMLSYFAKVWETQDGPTDLCRGIRKKTGGIFKSARIHPTKIFI